MIVRPWQTRRAEAFAAAVDTGTPADDHRPGVAELVRVAEGLSRVQAEAPRAEFVRDLRSELMREAPTALAPPKVVKKIVRVQPPPAPSPRTPARRRLATAAATFALAGGSFGLVSQSAQALPGETLYPVKRGVENTQLALERGPAAVGSERLDLARERLAEVEALAAEDDNPRRAQLVNETLDDFTAQASQGSGSLFDSYTRNGSPHTVDEVSAFTRSTSRSLATLSGSLPSSASGSYADAAEALTDINARVDDVCTSCEVSPLSGLPTSLSARAESLAGATQESTTPDESGSAQAAPREPADGTNRDGSDGGGPQGDGPSRHDGGSASASSPSSGTEAGDGSDPQRSSGSPGSGSDPQAPSVSDSAEKVTEPIERIVDPVLRGLLGSGGGSAGDPGRADQNDGRRATGGSGDGGGRSNGGSGDDGSNRDSSKSNGAGGSGSSNGSGGSSEGLIPGLLRGLAGNN